MSKLIAIVAALALLGYIVSEFQKCDTLETLQERANESQLAAE